MIVRSKRTGKLYSIYGLEEKDSWNEGDIIEGERGNYGGGEDEARCRQASQKDGCICARVIDTLNSAMATHTKIKNSLCSYCLRDRGGP